MNFPISVIGTNTPLMKISGNLIKVAKSIISDGLSAGGEEITVPKAEKQKAAIMVPKIREKLIISVPKRMTPTKITKKEIKSPNKAEAKISPNIIAHREIGEETNLSNVLILVSHGAITGVIAETVKKSAIPNKPGVKKSKDISLLNENDINRKAGISNP